MGKLSLLKESFTNDKKPQEAGNGRASRQEVLVQKKGREVRGNKSTGGNHEIHRISVCNVLVFYLVYLFHSWEHHAF